MTDSENFQVALIESHHKIVDCTFSTFSAQHAMKPFRMLATSELITALDLTRYCRVLTSPELSNEDLLLFHSIKYIEALNLCNIFSWIYRTEDVSVTFTDDCPPVEGVLDHARSIASGSLMAAVLLNSCSVNRAIHWSGGMHHAKFGDCSGFCYINDIVLSILELLKVHPKVLYVDLDVHHGDGVDEAFSKSPYVFTLSLHRFGDSFFPGTGHPSDIGIGRGRYYSMNIPLWEGITDFFFLTIFEYALESIVNKFSPSCIVLQCGADSLAEDRLGSFNLTSVAYGRCIEMVCELNVPTLFLGGGGYNIGNSAKLWSYLTSIICGNCVSPMTLIPTEKMPLTGWFFKSSPYLLVPSDQSLSENSKQSFQSSLKKILEQIDRHVLHLDSPFRSVEN